MVMKKETVPVTEICDEEESMENTIVSNNLVDALIAPLTTPDLVE